MRLKELLESIKLGEDDVICVWYKSPTDKYSSRINPSNWEKYYECDVNSFTSNDTRCIDPFNRKESVIKQYSIEIDWDEVRIIKERQRSKR